MSPFSELARVPVRLALHLPQRWRRFLVFAFQLLLAVASSYLAFNLRFDFAVRPAEFRMFMGTLPWLIVARGGTIIAFRLDEGIWRYVGLWDLRRITAAVVASTLLFFVFVRFGYGTDDYPRSVYLVDAAFLLIFLGSFRLSPRLYRDFFRVKGDRRLLILGAGDAGERLIRDIERNPNSEYDPVGFVDDDDAKVGQRILGVPVLGRIADLPWVMKRTRPEEIILAIPGAAPPQLRRIVTLLEPFNVTINTVVADNGPAGDEMRSLSVEDLLSREPVDLGVERVRALIAGRTVLVTGAGGSIGSELSRQIAMLKPKSLVLYERYENGLYATATALQDDHRDVVVHSLIGDVTDRARLNDVFADHRPEIVFHAAAHKHVPLMELNPCEAVKNNVGGTKAVAEAAARHGTERFILISTDKAVNPSSVMGATKRVAELVMQMMSGCEPTRFITVRFGNVLGSNGSVLLRFQDQIRAGGPLTVTDARIKRYFMLIPEAVELVLHAAALGHGGETLVLDMGEQIRVLDLARNLIRLSGHVPDEEIPIVFTGLRPGEKLLEELVADGETLEPSPVDKVRRVIANSTIDDESLVLALGELEYLAMKGDTDAVITHLAALVPGFRTASTLQSV